MSRPDPFLSIFILNWLQVRIYTFLYVVLKKLQLLTLLGLKDKKKNQTVTAFIHFNNTPITKLCCIFFTYVVK